MTRSGYSLLTCLATTSLGYFLASHYLNQLAVTPCSAVQPSVMQYSVLLCTVVKLNSVKCSEVSYMFSLVQCSSVYYSAVHQSVVQFSAVQFEVVHSNTRCTLNTTLCSLLIREPPNHYNSTGAVQRRALQTYTLMLAKSLCCPGMVYIFIWYF